MGVVTIGVGADGLGVADGGGVGAGTETVERPRTFSNGAGDVATGGFLGVDAGFGGVAATL
ncbi:MAG: hypothetical protein ABI650_01565, partial [Dokdonella sp.]